MIVVAYFQYDTQSSNIKICTTKEDAKEWLYQRWAYKLSPKECELYPIQTLEEVCQIFRECGHGESSGVIIEYVDTTEEIEKNNHK
jgi:hypothetical protein